MENANLKGYAAALGIEKKYLLDIDEVRKAFKQQILNPLISERRHKRIEVNLAYSQVCAIIYESKVS